MLDVQMLREQLPAVRRALARRGVVVDWERFEALETERRQLQSETQQLQAERNRLSKEIGMRKGQGEDVAPLLAAVASVKEALERNEARLAALLSDLEAFALQLPNLPHPSVPDGASDADNVVVSEWGCPRTFPFPVRDHVTIAEQLGGYDGAVAAVLSGSRFAVLKGEVAHLHRALVQFMMDVHTHEHGYLEVAPPFLVLEEALVGTGQLPKFAEDLFAVPRSTEATLYLIPTAEVPLTNLVRERILEEEELPLKFVAWTPCFRAEAGSHGRDVRGLIRQHQFEKVELVRIEHPEHSYAGLEELTAHAEAILVKLNLPYRKVKLCAGDLGFSAALTYDLEVWLPAQGRYREISSCSNTEAFQARRMQARFRPAGGGKPQPVHTLNGSGLAVGRTLVAVLENYQQEDGSVVIPEVLRPYLGGAEVIEPVVRRS
ncbi:MAG: serine--tRNA ligase [Hydrogenophilus sp.]|nr:serine--tRNA ligase [Hydrogenophilus sp.]